MSKAWENNMLEATSCIVYKYEDKNGVKFFIERYGESCYELGGTAGIDQFLIKLKNEFKSEVGATESELRWLDILAEEAKEEFYVK